ncbi:MAG: hypothetical protein ABSF81_16330 [Bacteroidales bacterium]
MLHDPGSYSLPLKLSEIILEESEKTILRKLAEEISEIASLPIHKEKAILWASLNDLKSVRPMVWINEVPWHEMNINDELTIRTKNPWAKELEKKLQREIYQWKHMRADMIINNFLECPLAIHSTDFGIVEDVDIVKTDENSDIYSRHFKIQIKEPKDIDKIKMPIITFDKLTTEVIYATMQDLFKDIIPVKQVGQTHIWFTPWDYLVRWWGVEEAMLDLILRPDIVNAAVERMTEAWIVELNQFVAGNLLSLDNNNTRVGSGGYGYTATLPGNKFDQDHVKPYNMWGCSNAQIFSQVSSEMHWEFALKHEIRWLEKWGLTYYGCCEPLDNKIGILRKIPNLRKISVSPWANLETIVREVGKNYVLSIKPSPAIFAGDNWNTVNARKYLKETMEKTQGVCHVEFIMKDISTVSYQPQRLWEWEKIAMDIVEKRKSK